MKQLGFVALIALGLFGAFTLPAGSQTPDTLDTFVTPEFVAISISGGPIQYGSVPLSAADNDRSTAKGGPFQVTNTGSVAVDLDVHGTDATTAVAGNVNWTLNCSGASGVVGANQFVHRFATSSEPDYDFTLGSALLCPGSENAKSLATGVAPEGVGMIDVVLQIEMPTSSTGFAERNAKVVVTATTE